MNRQDRLEGALEEIGAIFKHRLSTAKPVLEQHGRDELHHPSAPPDAVVFAHSTEEVACIVDICGRNKIPVIAFGAGTSLEGQIAAVRGGICIDLGQMDAIVQVNCDDLDATVQAGVTRQQLNAHLHETGLFFAVDPGAEATLGGMAATRASGTNAVRYGTMRDNVLSAIVVLGDGRIVKTGRRARKSSAGYDLTRLFIGSEGTLGIITELTVRLFGIPESVHAAVCVFDTIEDAVTTAIQAIQMAIPVARIELADETQMRAINSYSKLDLPVMPTLWLEFHGTARSVSEQVAMVQEIAQQRGGRDFQSVSSVEDRNRLWKARHNAAYACKAVRAGAEIWATDVCVPISRLAQCISETKEDLRHSTLVAPLIGHVGDGNFHLAILVDPHSPDEVNAAKAFGGRLIERALAMDGTCTGEHGIGLGKRDYLTAEHGAGVSVMRSIKQALDPLDILNPSKILPPVLVE